MTQQQRQNVIDAQNAFFDKEQANVVAQAAAKQAAADLETARANIATAHKTADQIITDANNAFFAAQSNQLNAIATAQAAQAAQDQAAVDLKAATDASLQTGATEDVSHTSPPMTPGGFPFTQPSPRV